MTIREYKTKHRPSMPEDVLAAGEFLEDNGFRFLVDFRNRQRSGQGLVADDRPDGKRLVGMGDRWAAMI